MEDPTKRIRGQGRFTHAFALGALVALSSLGWSVPGNAAGTWNGQDSLHVPISWCAIQGSPAQANPNLAGDTDTDAILWRRHERPTDNIYANPTGITLRSGINNAWGTFNFPIIADPDTTLGTQGDIRGEDVNNFGAEFNQVINACDTAYTNLGRAGIGVTAVNAGLFHDGAGNYVGIIGWGGCAEFPAGTCVAPYDGRVAVIDNRYLLPASPDRTFPPSPADPGGNLQFVTSDPFDQLTGHEVGHSLSLDHRNDNTALMNPGQMDNNGNGETDNIALNNAEVNALRANALNVPGLETDPAGAFSPGRYAVTRKVDKINDIEKGLPAFLDLASVKAFFDKKEGRVGIDLQVMGLLPKEGAPTFYYLVDVDGPERGASKDILAKLNFPQTGFRGADLLARVVVRGRKADGELFRIADGQIIQIRTRVKIELHTLVMYPHFATLSKPPERRPLDRAAPVHDIVHIEFEAGPVGITLGGPFRVQALVAKDGLQVVDRFDDDPMEKGVEFVLEDASFPHCSARGQGTPGVELKIDLEGLLPDAPIHGLLGPRLVFKGKSDHKGGGAIDFPIPKDAVGGFHLVTVGVDKTALTADCLIKVSEGGRGQAGIVTSFIIGTYDLRDGAESFLHIINPTGRNLRVVIAFFDDKERPVGCRKDKLSPNDLLEVDVGRQNLGAKFGVVKVVALNTEKDVPEVGVVGNQRMLLQRGISETSLHPVSEDILEEDWKYIQKACH